MPEVSQLKRPIRVEMPDGKPALIKTVPEALRWIELHVGDDPAWTRTRRALSEASAEGSLRKIRAATRAFEEAVQKPRERPGRRPG